MCGIIGSEFVLCPSAEQRDLALHSIGHRGPDENGFFTDTSFFLGHTRLSIIDISDGQQPFHFKDWVMVFNGEIYNFKILKEDLLKLDYTFETNSDTEVLLKAFDAFGTKFIERLDGMFAFAIYNKVSKDLHLGRDYFGIKPMFVYHGVHGFAFASEFQALVSLLKTANVQVSLNNDALSEYLNVGYINDSQLIEGIFEMPKGASYDLINNKLIKSYEIDYHFDTAGVTLQKHLENQIEDELVADIPVGILLSGGIDSSLLTALASKRSKDVLNTFSIAFEDKSMYDESEFATAVAKKFNTNHHQYLFTETDLINYIPVLIETLDEPIYDPAMLPMLFLSKMVSKEAKVVLSGDGGDELFGGYTHHRIAKYQFIFQIILKLLKPFTHVSFVKNKYAVLERNLNGISSLKETIKRDQDSGLNRRLLRKSDLCSMRYGVEIRVPFLSKRIFNYVERKGYSSFINPLFGKTPLRFLVWKLVGFKVAFKKKQGFRLPLKKWINEGNLGVEIERELVGHLIVPEEVIQKKRVKFLIENKEIMYNELFSLYLLNKWVNKTIN